jgi:alkylated DNA repair dioxygenase AlkB
MSGQILDLFHHQNPQIFDLPDADIRLFAGFFSPAESAQLAQKLEAGILWQQDQIRMFGKQLPIPRLNAWYGDADKSYTYSGIHLQPHPWNEDLLFIKERIEKETERKFTSVLLNLYRSGHDSMGWHADDEPELGPNPSIASVSFGASRMFQLRHVTKKLRANIPLDNGSLLVMQGTTQHHWQHQIPKTSKAIYSRINLTFRRIL